MEAPDAGAHTKRTRRVPTPEQKERAWQKRAAETDRKMVAAYIAMRTEQVDHDPQIVEAPEWERRLLTNKLPLITWAEHLAGGLDVSNPSDQWNAQAAHLVAQQPAPPFGGDFWADHSWPPSDPAQLLNDIGAWSAKQARLAFTQAWLSDDDD